MSAPSTRFAFFGDRIVPIAEATVSVMTHALHYGTAVFGGMRGYWNAEQEQLYVFRPHDHFTRFLQSGKLLRMPLAYTPAGLTEIVSALLRAEGFRENCYIRPLAYISEPTISVRVHDLASAVTIFAMPFGSYIANEEGAHVAFSAWRRVDDNAIPARGKIAGAYVNSALSSTDVRLAGYDEALVLNDDGHVSEMSSANFFIVRDGVAITPPVQSNVLEGIVRRSVIQLLRDELGVSVLERNIDRSEVYLADESFMCGTGVQIAAITRIEHRAIGSGSMGDITTRLRDLFFDVVAGKVERYRSWLVPVYT
ncbi:MAG: branched-chain amino acid transaminase [Gemmatimonadaceae bacterium]|nr:branched-chain amino acid transaminase [Gemmatimonadaceae bacterium]